MVVDAERGEGRDVDLEDGVGRERGGQLRVQPVDSLYEQHVVAVEAHRTRTLHAPPQLETVCREVDFFARKEAAQVRIEPFEVECVEAFVVVVAGLVERRLVAVHEIVVERNHLRRHEVGHELDCEPLGGSGLS